MRIQWDFMGIYSLYDFNTAFVTKEIARDALENEAYLALCNNVEAGTFGALGYYPLLFLADFPIHYRNKHHFPIKHPDESPIFHHEPQYFIVNALLPLSIL